MIQNINQTFFGFQKFLKIIISEKITLYLKKKKLYLIINNCFLKTKDICI